MGSFGSFAPIQPLEPGDVLEVELALEVGGRLEVSLDRRDPLQPAPQLEAVPAQGRPIRLELGTGENGTVGSTFLPVGRYTVRPTGSDDAASAVEVEVREREVTAIRFMLER